MQGNENQDPVCFHCGQLLPAGNRLDVEIDGASKPMCCHGCKAAAETIVACGLDRFYRMRAGGTPRPDAPPGRDAARYVAFDDPILQRRFVSARPDGRVEAALLLDGVVCAACCWLIEHRIAGLAGMDTIAVNYATLTARVRWDPARLKFSAILAAIAQLGYHAAPYDATVADRQLIRERTAQLRRIAMAGLFGMQIMMLSLGLYLGADGGVDPGLADLFRWAALLLVLPILSYSAQPFFRGTLRDLRVQRLGMDVPVALGIAIAFAGSVHALLTGRGDVYFDSIAMFVFILLCGRYVEFTVRRQSAAQWDRLQRIQPATATRIRMNAGDAMDEEVVPVSALQVGDQVRIRPGEVVPVDGEITTGTSSVNEALLTGESLPVTRGPGAAVLGGSINVESPLCVQVSRISDQSRLAQISRLARDVETTKPALDTLASRVASRFIVRLLMIAAGVALFWWFRDPARWVPITVSVLVITCPCALALAAPAALTAATGNLLRQGLLVRRAHAVETLARVTLFVFDKTGTLTNGELRLSHVDAAAGTDGDAALNLAAALEAGSAHPVGHALRKAARGPLPHAVQVRNFTGAGVAGSVAGREYFLGTAAFVQRMTGVAPSAGGVVDNGNADPATRIVLGSGAGTLATFHLCDTLRNGAVELIRNLARQGLGVRLLSGDGHAAVAAVAAGLEIGHAEPDLLPEQKVARLQQWRADSEVICMVGDGVNDAPVLAAAHVSVAMGGGADLARANADIILLENRLDALRAGIHVARRTLDIMRQNVTWAIAYNIIAVPLAAAGQVTPWMAALGMSLSSLLVVLNAARLART